MEEVEGLAFLCWFGLQWDESMSVILNVERERDRLGEVVLFKERSTLSV